MKTDSAWKEEFLVGDEYIDNQHKELIALCGSIQELANSGKPVTKEEAHARLTELFEEFRNHFDEEMQIYRRVYRMKYTEHEQHHAEFLEKITDIMNDTRERTPDLKELMVFIQHWFIKHIVFEDIPQFEEIRARGFHREEWGA